MTADQRRILRRRLCADVAACMLTGRRRELKACIRRALKKGRATRRFFEEVMLHLSLVLGFPHMLQGLEVLAELEPRAGRGDLAPTGEGRLRQRGEGAFTRVYGAQSSRVRMFLDSLVPGLSDWILENVYGRVYARPALSLAEREILTIVSLVYHNQTKQLTGHLHGALRTGLMARELRNLLVRIKERHGIASSGAQSLLKDAARRRRPRQSNRSSKRLRARGN